MRNRIVKKPASDITLYGTGREKKIESQAVTRRQSLLRILCFANDTPLLCKPSRG